MRDQGGQGEGEPFSLLVNRTLMCSKAVMQECAELPTGM